MKRGYLKNFMAFWNKKHENPSPNPLNSEEYERLVKRIIEFNSKVAVLETNMELLKTDVANLRGKFNQRLKGLKEEEGKEEKKEIETINNTEFVGIG